MRCMQQEHACMRHKIYSEERRNKRAELTIIDKVKPTPRMPAPGALRPGRRRTPPRALGAAVRAARHKRDVDMAAFGSEGRSSGDRGWEGGGREWMCVVPIAYGRGLYIIIESRRSLPLFFPLATSSPLSSALASRFFLFGCAKKQAAVAAAGPLTKTL